MQAPQSSYPHLLHTVEAMEREKRTRERRGEGRQRIDMKKVTRCKAMLTARRKGVVESADGDARGEFLTICCCLTIYDNGNKSD
jgi:hypothetical protein